MDIAHQLHRIETLTNTLTILEGQYNDPQCDIEEKCIDLFTSLAATRESIASLRHVLRNIMEQIKMISAKRQEVRDLNKYIEHVQNQLPKENNETVFEPKRLVMGENEAKNDPSPVPHSWAQLMSPCIKNTNSVPFANLPHRNEPSFPSISYVTEPEMNAVPKYMKGRCNVTVLNKLIESLNTACTKKYETLSKPKKTIKQKDLEYYYEWKRTENMEPKGTHFITIKDINIFGNMKMDKASFNMITILRHLKRLKETRHANNEIHYIFL